MGNVSVRTESVVIPTYTVGEKCRHPLFLDKRVYQGSSGKVYPNAVRESVGNEKIYKEYNVIFLENEYLEVMIMPELGGKIHRILDKTNNYDAVYHNEVIKPYLAGLAGPWTAGGIEFNWPLHHRPSTYEPVDCKIVENEDGSITVWCGEIEKMYHTKGMAGFTLYPGKAYLEVRGQLYNPTEVPQRFLWWSNACVSVNENTKTIFPPDVHAVMDRSGKEVTRFPVAMSEYCGIDYSEGVDISRYKNITAPTSYTAEKSEYDFMGNYDFGREAGLLHVASHHISPGKKQWTAGCGDFGRAWEHGITDENGPYAELMAGAFTDGQPDFTFLMPYEEKRFKQYFLPYKKLGEVKNATADIAANVEYEDGYARLMLYATSKMKVSVRLIGKSGIAYMRETVTVSPVDIYETKIKLDEDEEETSVRLVITNLDGEVMLRYRKTDKNNKMPAPSKEIKPPKEISSMEELYLSALHLEQYRHATRRAEDYYLEGLKRDSEDMRLNNGYGKMLYKKGLFEEAELHFRRAINRATMLNPTPYDCEPYYNLGLALKMQKKYTDAYDAFSKAVWDGKLQCKGYYQLACVSAKLESYSQALEFVEQSLIRNTHNMKARTLKSALMRRDGRIEEAVSFNKHSLSIDALDFGSRYELFLLTQEFEYLNELTTLMHGEEHNYIELSIIYAEANLYTDAANILALVAESEKPMLHYYMAYYSNSQVELDVACKCNTDYTFPNSLQDLFVLQNAVLHNPEDWFARYSLGNLYYDKGIWEKSIEYWRAALEISPRNSAVMRNLAIAEFNCLGEKEEALKLMERAAMFAPEDARIYYELDLLRKLMNYPVKKRLKDMADRIEMVESRDDLFIEYITLLNSERHFDYALKAIKRHTFHPWEGAEGKITYQYKLANMGCAWDCLLDEDYEEAVNYLNQALVYPENLGEGRRPSDLDNDIYFMLGMAYEKTDKIQSNEYFTKATEGDFKLSAEDDYTNSRPSMYYFRSLAYERLGNKSKAMGGYNKLINYCEQHIDDKPEIDYFATSHPDFVVFEGDLTEDNFVHCCYLAALGYSGKGMQAEADKYIEMGLEKNVSHQGLIALKNKGEKSNIKKTSDPMVLRTAKWNTSKNV